ncbi:MAG: DEAD/DEAH box helicase [Actinomycetota bacterium]|jgi:ATP-dependent Lhr-like helicase|nr:DEAD/DEAH box helicase [Actinomycetota bacterium]
MPQPPALPALHPAVAAWFAGAFPEGPTEPQALGWPLVEQGGDVLIAAPTGSGKTLAGFLMAINQAYRAHERGEDITGRTRVVYVSPLKALAVDVHQNLERPLAEIAQAAESLGLTPAPVTVAVRTGDTTSGARAAMVKAPPTILVTTPESLYLYLTAERSRQTLTEVKTVVVDEIHALARDKRGSHLALSLERLDHVQAAQRPQRVGLSATQRPIEVTARLLSGAAASVHVAAGTAPTGTEPTGTEPTGTGPRVGARHVEVVDCGHTRDRRVSIELPEQELAAVLSQEQLAEVVERIAAHVKDHRTTLVFVNTRRLSERLAHLLGELLGPDVVAAHHGSLSAERRKRTEARLRAGELRALVATASLELGIDIGPVELVCQVGSPRAVSTFLQRVGRSNHSRYGVPEGVLFPTSRDELVECAALLAAVRRGRLDAVLAPEAPLDILAQQVIAEVAAAGEWEEDALYDLVVRSAPYGELRREDFEAVVELASQGIQTGRGARMAFLHHDRVNRVLRPRRGARLAALTSGGAIPEIGDYRVVAEPDEMFVGTVNEDFAVESMPGDVFLLGTHPWRIRRVGAGEIRVVDAEGARPTIPFWLGEAPSRTVELSDEVSSLRRLVAAELRGGGPEAAVKSVRSCCGLEADAAEQLVAYLSTGLAQLGVMPSDQDVVFERFFDQAAGMQLVVHAPFGGRVNRALGLALRKRFCVTFDFELQAAANDDAVILSLGPQHSFPLPSVPRMVHPNTAQATLEQAVLASPMFTSRWRWDLSRSLAILRFRGGKKNPLPVQRMEADDLMAAIFPALAACQENTPPGPVELPDHVIVRQVLYDCLHEAMDIDGLRSLVSGLHSGEIRAHFVDSVEPSVLAHEIVNSEPYTYLDDAPLEERRARQVQLRRGLPVEARDLSLLDPAAIEKVRTEAAPSPRSADELHDLLLSTLVHRPKSDWEEPFDALVASGRAMRALPAGAGTEQLWCATERREWASALLPGARFEPDYRLGAPQQADPPDVDEAAALALRGHLGLCGPVTAEALAGECGLAPSRVLVGLARLEAEGFAMQGHFDPTLGPGQQWCARHLLARIHGYTQSRLRRETKPVSAQEFMRFLLRWQHVAPGTRRQGRAGLLAVIEQLQGWEAAAGAWEEAVFPARVEGYQARWLDELCLSGEVAWGRLSVRGQQGERTGRRGASTPSRATPVTFALRPELSWLVPAKRGSVVPEEPPHGAGRDVLDALRERGAMFISDLPAATGRLPTEVQEGLWDLVARGLVTADGFSAVRSLFAGREVWARQRLPERRHLPQRRHYGTSPVPGTRAALRQPSGGRWALFIAGEGPAGAPGDEGAPVDELAELVAGQLLARWGVVFWDLAAYEGLSVPWRDVLWALRRFEARGIARGGRFVSGFAGEQYALPEALDELRHASRSQRKGELVRLSGVDPLNLTGVVLAGKRVPALRTSSVLLRDGEFVPSSLVSQGPPGDLAVVGR